MFQLRNKKIIFHFLNWGPGVATFKSPEYISHDMRFPTIMYVQPAKAQTSLGICSLIRAFASGLNILPLLSY